MDEDLGTIFSTNDLLQRYFKSVKVTLITFRVQVMDLWDGIALKLDSQSEGRSIGGTADPTPGARLTQKLTPNPKIIIDTEFPTIILRLFFSNNSKDCQQVHVPFAKNISYNRIKGRDI